VIAGKGLYEQSLVKSKEEEEKNAPEPAPAVIESSPVGGV
jgi:hypothetical protein